MMRLITPMIFMQIDWAGIWNNSKYFLLGFLTGIILLMLSLLWIFSSKERRKTKIRLSEAETISDKEILEMIQAKQSQLDQTVKLTDNGYFKVAFDLSFELTQEIAAYYFPKSKYPIYELSLQEMLDLNYYITKRMEALVNGRFLKHFKNYRVATIIDILNTRKRISNSKLMKLTRKAKLQQIYTAGRAVLNYANPVFWFRKLAIKPTTVLVTKEICKYIITVFGEETNKIYSKTIFRDEQKESELIRQIDELVESEEEN